MAGLTPLFSLDCGADRIEWVSHQFFAGIERIQVVIAGPIFTTESGRAVSRSDALFDWLNSISVPDLGKQNRSVQERSFARLHRHGTGGLAGMLFAHGEVCFDDRSN